MFTHYLKDEEKQSIINRSLSQKGPQHVRGHSAASLVHKKHENSSTTRPSTNQASKATKTNNPKQLTIDESSVPFMFESRSVKKPKYDVEDASNNICSTSSNHIVQTEPSRATTTTHTSEESSRINPTILSKRQHVQKTLEITTSETNQNEGGDQEKTKNLNKKKKKVSRKQIRGDSATVAVATTHMTTATSFSSNHLLNQLQKGSTTTTSQMNAFLMISPYSDNLNAYAKYLPDSRRYRPSASPKQRTQLSKRASLVVSANTSNANSTLPAQHTRTNQEANNNNNSNKTSTPKNVKLTPLNSKLTLNQLRTTATTTASAVATPDNSRQITRPSLLVNVERSPPTRSPEKVSAANVVGSETNEEAANNRLGGNRAQPRSFSIDCAHLLKNNNNSANRLTYSTQFPFLERSTYLAGISPKSQSQTQTQSPLRSRMGQSELIEQRAHANSSEIYQRSEPSPKQQSRIVFPTTAPSNSSAKKTKDKKQTTLPNETVLIPAGEVVRSVTENNNNPAGKVKVKQQKQSNVQNAQKQVIVKKIPRQSIDRIYNNRIIHMIEPLNVNTTHISAEQQPSNKQRKKSPNNNAKSKRSGSNHAHVKSEKDTPPTKDGRDLPEEVPAFNPVDIVMNQKSDSPVKTSNS